MTRPNTTGTSSNTNLGAADARLDDRLGPRGVMRDEFVDPRGKANEGSRCPGKARTSGGIVRFS